MGLFKKPEIKTIKDQIIDFFHQINYKFQVLDDTEEKTVIKTGINLSIGNTDGYLVIHHKLALVEVLAYSPVHVPDNKRMEVSKLFELADGTTYIGNLQMNHETGEMRCKTYFKFSKNPTDPEIINDNFFESFHVLERFVPAAMRIIYGKVTAQTAFNEIFGRVNPTDN
jgi:hypothetical protein